MLLCAGRTRRPVDEQSQLKKSRADAANVIGRHCDAKSPVCVEQHATLYRTVRSELRERVTARVEKVRNLRRARVVETCGRVKGGDVQ